MTLSGLGLPCVAALDLDMQAAQQQIHLSFDPRQPPVNLVYPRLNAVEASIQADIHPPLRT